MQITEAQREVRSVYLNGSVGQVISGLFWLISTALATWVNPNWGLYALFIGGMLIFLATQFIIKLMGHRATLSKDNPFNQLAMQIAFIIPLSLPVILAAVSGNSNWLYPAFMIVVGTHYLPFMFLYGMWQFGVLSALLIGGAMLVRMFAPESFTLGGWLTGAVLILFGLLARSMKKD